MYKLLKMIQHLILRTHKQMKHNFGTVRKPSVSERIVKWISFIKICRNKENIRYFYLESKVHTLGI